MSCSIQSFFASLVVHYGSGLKNDCACAKFENDVGFCEASLFQNIENGFYFPAEMLSFPNICSPKNQQGSLKFISPLFLLVNLRKYDKNGMNHH